MIGLMWRRIRKKRSYVIRVNAVLYGTARIVNNRSRDAIEIGKYTHVKGELLTFGHGGRIRLGEYCFVGENSYIWSAKEIFIGDRVLIAHNCNIFDNDTHPVNPEARHHQFREIITAGQPREIDLREEGVIIEDDAWIAAGSSVLKGVRIGRAAIVGTGSVVTRDVPPYTIVAGNPARVIREIPSEER